MLHILEFLLEILNAFQNLSLRQAISVIVFFAPFVTTIGIFITARYFAAEHIGVWVVACIISWLCFFYMMLRKKNWSEDD